MTIHRAFLSCSLLAGSLLGACGSDADAPGSAGSPDYALRGPHPVGFTVLAADDGATSSPTTKAWYPAQAALDPSIVYPVSLQMPDWAEEPVDFLGTARRDAAPEPSGAPYPLVVLSHGFALNPEWYHHLAEHLASHGFVVLAPEHEESDWFEDVIAATVSRPRQVSATIDLAESGVLDGTIDVGRVAVLGHSYGGYTALAAAGGRIHLEDLERRCEGVEDAFSAAYFCDTFLSSTDELATHFGLAAPPVGAWPALSDARVDAVVAIAGDAYLFGDKGLRDISLPTLLVGGTGDTGTPWDWGVGLAFDHLVSAPVVRVAFEGAEHFVGVTPCEHMPWTASMPDDLRGWLCDDPAWDRREAARLISEMSTAFILSTLADDAEAKAVLAPGHHGNVDGLEIIVNQ